MFPNNVVAESKGKDYFLVYVEISQKRGFEPSIQIPPLPLNYFSYQYKIFISNIIYILDLYLKNSKSTTNYEVII